jgi:ATP-dependent RNA circularization protein (DNA/RNA ligase family)
MNPLVEFEQKKYPSIVRYGKKGTKVFKEGDRIVIYEKLDGANASFTRVGDKLLAFSRNTQLDEHNTLRGFYNFVQSLNVEDFEEGLIYFGEWLVRHTLDYGEENMNQFYLFDIYDMTLGKEFAGFIDHQYVRLEAAYLGFKMAPILYEGPYISEEHMMSFVGQSKLGEVGAGIVIKDYRRQLFVKIVSEKFSEAKAKSARVSAR